MIRTEGGRSLTEQALNYKKYLMLQNHHSKIWCWALLWDQQIVKWEQMLFGFHSPSQIGTISTARATHLTIRSAGFGCSLCTLMSGYCNNLVVLALYGRSARSALPATCSILRRVDLPLDKMLLLLMRICTLFDLIRQ